MNLCPYIQVGGEDAHADTALAVELRAGRMPVDAVRVVDVAGSPHLAWTSADGLDEAISLADVPHLADIARASAGCILVEFDEHGPIESSAQVVRADAPEIPREVCHG